MLDSGGALGKLGGSKTANTTAGGSGGAGNGAVAGGGGGTGSGGPWGEAGTGGSGAQVPTPSSELWAAPKSRPPPGLSAKPQSQSQGQTTTSAPTTNGWGSLGSRWPTPAQAPWPSTQATAPAQAGSTWLLLRNLTPQVNKNSSSLIFSR